jgi:hypothetical protein
MNNEHDGKIKPFLPENSRMGDALKKEGIY